ncbi:MAG: 3'-5' exonuclease [Planctomycetota bacterium]
MPGVEPTTLSSSYRSSQVVLDAVNQVFTKLVGNPALTECQSAAQQWQGGFELHRAIKAELLGHVVLQTTASDGAVDTEQGDDEIAAPPDAHAHYVAGYIKTLTESYPGQTIGVLMRSRAKGRTLMHALRSLGVRAAEEGGNPISHNAAVAAVLAAIQFADHPGDAVARFHTMNSPMGELLGLDSSANPDQVACNLRQTLMDRGFASVIADWMQRLAPSCDAVSLRRLTQLIELAEGYDSFGATLRPGFFVQSVRAAKVEDAAPAPVRVMTIHASKGLEFDAVVLPDLDANLSSQDSKDLVVLDRDSPIDSVRGVYRRVPKDLIDLTPDLKHAHEQRAHEKRTEDLCLLYVAMTRAKQALHMLVRPLKETKGGKPSTTGRTNLSYAAVLRQALSERDDEGYEGDECLFEIGTKTLASGTLESRALVDRSATTFEPIRLASTGGKPGRSWVKASPSQMHHQASVSAADLLRLDPTGGQRYGNAVHAMLEQVGFIDEGPPDEAAMRRVGEAAGMRGNDLQQALASLQRTLQQPAAQQLLARDNADALWRERRFIVHLDEQLIAGVFDRVHLYHQDDKPIRAKLIDFKTDRVDDQSIDAVVSGYADQIRLYRRALSVMLGLDPAQIESVLYFVGDDRVVPIT